MCSREDDPSQIDQPIHLVTVDKGYEIETFDAHDHQELAELREHWGDAIINIQTMTKAEHRQHFKLFVKIAEAEARDAWSNDRNTHEEEITAFLAKPTQRSHFSMITAQE